jgi:hypothetical protein
LLQLLSGHKFSGIIDVLFWYFTAKLLFAQSRSSGQLLQENWKTFSILVVFFLVIAVGVYSVTDSDVVRELLFSRIFTFQGQTWWFFYNIDVPSWILNDQLWLEAKAILNPDKNIITGVEYMMSFILSASELAVAVERGYLYTFGYPTTFLAMGFPFIGLFVCFIVSASIVFLISRIRNVVSLIDFIHVAAILTVLAGLLIFVQVGSISAFITLGFLFKVFVLICLEVLKRGNHA